MRIWWGRKTRELGGKTLESDQDRCWRFDTRLKTTLSGYSEICHIQLKESRYLAWNTSYTQIKMERFTGTVYWNEVSNNSRVHAENVHWKEKAFASVMLYSYRDTEVALENFLWTKHELQSFSYRFKSSLQGEPGNKGPDGDLVSACYFSRPSSQ